MKQFIAADGTRLGNRLQIVVNTKHVPQVGEEVEKQFSWNFQENGWINDDIFMQIIQQVRTVKNLSMSVLTSALVEKYFIPQLEARRLAEKKPQARSLLLLDGHTSHSSPAMLEALRLHNVDVVLFLPHATHILQPLDLEVFGAFKRLFKTVPAHLHSSPLELTSTPENHAGEER